MPHHEARDVIVLPGTCGEGRVVDRRQLRPADRIALPGFIVDGESLRERLRTTDVVTPLNRPWLPGVTDAVDVLLGRRPDEMLPPGRVSILVCGTCGDLGCGAVTVTLRVDEVSVIWDDFGRVDWSDDVEEVPGQPGQLVFDRRQYEAALTTAHAQVAAFPYDELAHKGKRFLWPREWGWLLPPRNSSGS